MPSTAAEPSTAAGPSTAEALGPLFTRLLAAVKETGRVRADITGPIAY